jgi:hypothetical protein
VSETNGQLGKATPERPLWSGRFFPDGLEHLVCREGTAGIDQSLCLGQRGRRWQRGGIGLDNVVLSAR